MKKILFAFAFLLILASCEEDAVRFSEPQPSGVSSDQRLRSDFIGRYLNAEDSAWLIITPEKVAFQPFHIRVRLDSSENNSSNKDLNINIHSGNEKSRLQIDLEKDENDSLVLHAEAEDEIFNLKKGGIAKFHKGYYFLNSPFEEGNGFKVRILTLTKEGIILSRIASDSVLHLLENEEFVHKTSKDKDEDHQWRLNPSRKQLKKLMNMGLFSEITEFRRVK